MVRLPLATGCPGDGARARAGHVKWIFSCFPDGDRSRVRDLAIGCRWAAFCLLRGGGIAGAVADGDSAHVVWPGFSVLPDTVGHRDDVRRREP